MRKIKKREDEKYLKLDVFRNYLYKYQFISGLIFRKIFKVNLIILFY